MEVTKELLESFTKNELLDIFKSLAIKESENKETVVLSVFTGQPTEKEKEAFKKAVDEKKAEGQEEKTEKKQVFQKYKGPGKPAKPGQFVVLKTIKEDGEVFKPGEDYTGKRALKYLGDQIREKDK